MSRIFFLTETERKAAIARITLYLFKQEASTPLKVEVSEFKRTRSNEQNRYLWGVAYATVLQQLPGWDAEDVHEYFLGEWSGWETLEGFGRKRLRPIRRSSRLSTAEFSDFVGFIQRTMAERGVIIPDPGEVSDGA